MRGSPSWSTMIVLALAALIGPMVSAEKTTRDGMPDGNKLPGLVDTSGKIVSLGHSGALHFCNIHINLLTKQAI